MNELDLFAAAIAIADAKKRDSFLDRECSGNADLRRRLDLLLEALGRSHNPLDGPLGDPNATEAHQPQLALVGAILAGRYRLLEEIGGGGMGAVWMAEQREPVKRLVAVKLIKAGMDSKAVLARFEVERQVLAIMDHPNISKVLDGGTTDDGKPFFVMELVKGLPLTEYCDARKLSVKDRLDLFVQICSAVQHAHQKAVIHRDLKPSNVLVTEHDGKPVPKVIDFGLAKALNASHMLTERTLHTAYGTVVGTPLYMAPEQVGINALDVDTRTDIYALGVILYELLTGSTPFEKARFREAAWDEVQRLIREEEPPRPSMRLISSNKLPLLAASRQTEPRRLTKQVRGELDWIVMKALEKDRTRRYETANGFAAEVLRYLNGEPVQAHPPSTVYRLKKFVRRYRRQVIAASLVLTALVTGIVGTSWGLIQAEVAAEAERHARGREAEQRRIAEEAAEGASASSEQNRRLRYSSDVLLASQVWEDEDGTAQHVESLLNGHVPAPGIADLREFAWRLQSYQLKQCANVYKPADSIRQVGISESAVFALDSLGMMTMWNGMNATTRSLAGGPVKPVAVDLSSDGNWAAIISAIGQTGVIDATSGKIKHELKTPSPQNKVKFSANGRFLVTVGNDGLARIWNVETGRCAHEMQLRSSKFGHLELSHDGRLLLLSQHLISATSTVVALYRVGHADPISLHNSRGSFATYQVCISHDGRLAACGNAGGLIYVWDTKNGKEVARFKVRAQALRVSFSPNNEDLAVGEKDGRITFWNIAKGSRILILKGHTDAIQCLRFSVDGQAVISAAKDGSVRKWSLDGNKAARNYWPNETSQIDNLAFSPNGRWFARTSNPAFGRGLLIFDRSAGTPARVLDPKGGGRIAFARDNRWVALGGYDGCVRLFEPATGILMQTLQSPLQITMNVGALAVFPDSKRLAAGYGSHTGYGSDEAQAVAIWEIDKPTPIQIFRLPSQVNALALSQDGSRLAAGTHQGSLHLWETNGWSKLAEWASSKKRPCGAMHFSPDGKSLLTGSWNHIDLWDLSTLTIRQTLTGHADLVNCMALSPDGRTLATAGWDHTIKLWDTMTWRELRSMREHSSWVYSIAFSPGGDRLASGGVDGRQLDWVAGPMPIAENSR